VTRLTIRMRSVDSGVSSRAASSSKNTASVSGYDESFAVGTVVAARDLLSGNLEPEKPNPGPTLDVEEKTNESVCHDSSE
jgi:hypothetical protein